MSVGRAILWGLIPLFLGSSGYAQGVIAIYPAPTTVTRGSTRQFTTYITVSPATVTWTVNGVTGGTTTDGTITQAGLYTAPAVIPMANVVKVRATSTAKPTVYGESVVTI